MSIASAITNAQGKVANAYTAVSNKGGTLPATQDLSNLPTAINSIPSGGGSDTVPSYQIVSGALTRRTDTYNLTGNEFSNVTNIGYEGLYNAFYKCSGLTGSIDLSGVTSIDGYGLYYAFYYCTGLTSIDLSNVTSIGTYGLRNAFYNCTGLTGSIDLSSVTSIDGYGLGYVFSNCTGITSVDLSSVTSIRRNGLNGAFHGCYKLQTINFDSLKTTSFGDVTALNSMFNSYTGSEATGGCTVHFPNNLQSTISGLTGYPTFGGSSNYITLSFDLPATS